MGLLYKKKKKKTGAQKVLGEKKSVTYRKKIPIRDLK